MNGLEHSKLNDRKHQITDPGSLENTKQESYLGKSYINCKKPENLV